MRFPPETLANQRLKDPGRCDCVTAARPSDLEQDAEHRQRQAVRTTRSPGSSSKRWRQQTPATVISMATALPREDNQQLPTDLPKRATTRLPTCNRRTPRPPNGVEQQPGRSPGLTAPTSTRHGRGRLPL